jgi:hypothetical protein
MHRMVTEGDIPRLKYLQAVIEETFCLHPQPTTRQYPSVLG